MKINSNIETDLTVKDGILSVSRTQDCDPLAEHCKNLVSINAVGSKDIKFAGTIPDVFVEKYCNDHGILFSEFMSNKEHVRRIMNDPAMEHFRVWKGKL